MIALLVCGGVHAAARARAEQAVSAAALIRGHIMVSPAGMPTIVKLCPKCNFNGCSGSVVCCATSPQQLSE